MKNPSLRLMLTLAVVLALVGLPMSAAQSRRRPQRHLLRRCQRAPRFSVNGVEPMTLTLGRVTVVALLTHTCSFCQRQAHGLNELLGEFRNNRSDVTMFIVNKGRAGPGSYNVGFPVYQDDLQEQVWRRVFGGQKDDIFVFNRCGMLTYRIGMPYAYLGYSYVRRAIHMTLHTDICPDCQRQGPPVHQASAHTDGMQADAPVSALSPSYLPFVHGRRRQRRFPFPSGNRFPIVTL